jgi:hypothetical protein
MISGLWLRLAVRQLLRTLGQQRAAGPLLLVFILTFPAAIVAVDQMAPYGHEIFWKLGQGAASKLAYGWLLLAGVLLLPLQLRLLQDLDSSRELENLERFPLPRRALFHFELLGQLVIYGPLLGLLLLICWTGGLFSLQENLSEYRQRRQVGRTTRSTPARHNEPVTEILDRAQRAAWFHVRRYIAQQQQRHAQAGHTATEHQAAARFERERAATLLPLCSERTLEVVDGLAAKRPPATRRAFTLLVWEHVVIRPLSTQGPLESVDDIVPLAQALWEEQGFRLPLSWPASLLLVGLLAGAVVGVQLLLVFLTASALGLLAGRTQPSRPRVMVGALAALVLGLALIAMAYPSARYPSRQLEWLPWLALPRAVELVEQGQPRLALAPLAMLLLQLILLYELAGWSYQRTMLVNRDTIHGNLNILMTRPVVATDLQRSGPLRRGIFGRILPQPLDLLVTKDGYQLTRPPVNRLMIALLAIPFMALASPVGLGIAIGAPDPFRGGPIPPYGLAALLLMLYGGLALFWIPCAQVFLFSFERWALTALWFGPFDHRQLFRSKAIAAMAAIAPAITLTYTGMALFIATSGHTPWLTVGLAGLAFIGTTTVAFGLLVTSLGILFPYFLQTRFRHLAGGLGFMMQLALLPSWIACWMFFAVCVNFFGYIGLAIAVALLCVWSGFVAILVCEAHIALARLGREHGRSTTTTTTERPPLATSHHGR